MLGDLPGSGDAKSACVFSFFALKQACATYVDTIVCLRCRISMAIWWAFFGPDDILYPLNGTNFYMLQRAFTT